MPLLSGSLPTPKRSSSFKKFGQNPLTKDSVIAVKIFESMRFDSTRIFVRTWKTEHQKTQWQNGASVDFKSLKHVGNLYILFECAAGSRSGVPSSKGMPGQ
jgi:hypothetical protein